MERRRFKSDDLSNWMEHGIDVKTRTIYLHDDIDPDSMQIAVKALFYLESLNTDPINLVICSGGGSVEDGFALVDAVLESKCKIHTHVRGHAESMAFVIFMAGDTRTCSNHAVLMNHQGVEDIEGNPLQIKSQLQIFETVENWCADLFARQTGKPKSYWTTSIRSRNIYYTKKEALELGIVTEE